jgi:hypothetical protein
MFILKRVAPLVVLFCFSKVCFGAMISDTVPNQPKSVISFYTEGYYMGINNSLISKGERALSFLYNYNRKNSFSINLALLRFSCLKDRYRYNAGLQAGDYVNDNYQNENKYLKYISEFNFGFRFFKKNWVDAGVFPSYIGFESNIGSENLTSSRSILAENSPYYLCGIRVVNPISNKVALSEYVLSGWQRIAPISGNSIPSFGWQLQYQISNSSLLNWSTFVGSDYPDSNRRMRYFNNFYWQTEIGKIKLIAGLDLGAEQERRKCASYKKWYAPVLIFQMPVNKYCNAAFRLEKYSDPFGVIISNGGGDINSISCNFDFSRVRNLIIRSELRTFYSKNGIYSSVGNVGNQLSTFLICASYKFSRIK